MKKIVFLVLAVALVSCGGHEKIKYVDTSVRILDSIGKKNGPKLDSIAQQILLIPEISRILNEKLTVKDSVANVEEEGFRIVVKYLEPTDSLGFKGKINHDNTILVTKYSNLSEYNGRPNDSVQKNKQPFDLALFKKGDYFMPGPAKVWHYYNDPDFIKRMVTDSLQAGEKKEMLEDNSDYLAKAGKAKYAVLIADVYNLKPKLVDKKTFESGMLLTIIKIYDLVTKEKIGQKILLTANGDEITTLPDMSGDGQFSLMQISADLAKRRTKAVYDFLDQISKAPKKK